MAVSLSHVLLLRLITCSLFIRVSLCWTGSSNFFRKRRIGEFSSSLQAATNDDDDDAAALSRALAGAHPAQSSWYSSYDGLPFDCTECGKCCKTQGSVYMAPNEIQQAATILNISRKDFIESYASRLITNKNDDESSAWIRLKNNNDGACVFLDAENHCTIYQARPVQCSTYPFWPKILESKQAWNDEVRKPDNETSHDEIPYWTAHGGGCEGMKCFDGDGNSFDTTVVSPFEAHYKLMEYERAEATFPKNLVTRRVRRKQKD